MQDVLIVGGGTAGLTAAIYARRAGLSCTVFEGGTPGGQIVTSPEVDNYPAMPKVSGFDYAMALLKQVQELDAEIIYESVISAELGGKTKRLCTANGEYEGKSVIIANGVLRQGVQSISDLVNATGLVNCDFADVTEIMKDAGYAHMGVGHGKGKDKAEVAAQQAISSPLLQTSIDGARGVLLNITASNDIGLEEIDAASSVVMEAVHPDCEIIWGANFDEDLEDEMIITVIATRFGEDGPGAPIKSTTASKPVAPPTEIPAAPASFTSNDDDSLNDIVSFFKK